MGSLHFGLLVVGREDERFMKMDLPSVALWSDFPAPEQQHLVTKV